MTYPQRVFVGLWPPTRAGVTAFIRGWRCAAPWWACLRRPWLVPVVVWRTSAVLAFKVNGDD